MHFIISVNINSIYNKWIFLIITKKINLLLNYEIGNDILF